jgi:hypothetical protein
VAQQRLQPDVNWNLDHVTLFDEASKHVPREAMQGPVLVSSDPAQHVAWLQDLVALGFDEVYLHHVGQEQTEWLEVFGEKVLPQLDVTGEAARHPRRPQREDHRHRRPVVEDRRRLLPRRRDLLRLRRRRAPGDLAGWPSASTTWPTSASRACG